MNDPKAAPGPVPPGNQLPMPPEALMKLPDVLRLTAFSRTTFYELVKLGVAPKPVHVGASAFWRYGEVLAFLRRDPAEMGEALRAARMAQGRATREA